MSKLIVKAGAWWRHIENKTMYRILYIANDKAIPEKMEKFPLTVVYAQISKGEVWTRRYEEFVDKFEQVDI